MWDCEESYDCCYESFFVIVSGGDVNIMLK